MGKRVLLKTFAIAAILTAALIPARAVTDKEMDEARAITAKEYLRWANDGSGYLDDIKVKSMDELNAALKAKEKENIKAFNAVETPKDYASWDKAKLVEYWSVTFFKSSGLDEKGKGARSRVKNKLNAMSISEPVPETQEVPAVTSEAAEATEANVEPEPTADVAIAEQEDILADQKAIENDAALAEESRHPESSNTWVYILVLVILVAIVVWLVVYAANLMKRQSSDIEGDDDADKVRAQARLALAKKDEEIKKLHERLQTEENRSAELGMEMERIKLDNSRMKKQLEQLRNDNRSSSAPTGIRKSSADRLREEKETEKIFEPVKEEPKHEKKAEKKESKPSQNILNVIYLGRANRRGIFVRADRRLNPGNTIYKLDTNDGMVGTFHVVDRPEVLETALSNPSEYLATGCTCEDLEDTIGVTRIVTESAGTAIFENGYWKVLRKTRIRYE